MAGTLFHCDDLLWQRFTALCRERDETPGAVLRDLVRLEVKNHLSRKARRNDVPDEPLLARLRLLVAEALVEAQDWTGLQKALRDRGLCFVPAGGGLNLTDVATGATLAKSSQVGPAYLALVRRFGSAFPGHPRPGIARQALSHTDCDAARPAILGTGFPPLPATPARP